MFSGFYKLSVLISVEQQEVELFMGTNKSGNDSFQVVDLSIHLN
jgi:hypothetical protein